MNTGVGRGLSGKRVFVTGHTGFKGSWLCLWLKRLGVRISGYSLAPPTKPNLFEAAGVEEDLDHHIIADVRDLRDLSDAIDKTDPDVVFHLAAQPIVRQSYQEPLETFSTNIVGTLNLLEVLRTRTRPTVAVIVTSDKCYENTGQLWGYREIDPMGGHDPYSASKGAAELVVASYRRSFFSGDTNEDSGVRISTVRAGNVIGGGDWAADRLVPDTVLALAAGRSIPIRNSRAVRPWQHVLDVLSGYLCVADRLLTADEDTYSQAWNFGPSLGEALDAGSVAQRFVDEWGSGAWVDASTPSQPKEAHFLRLNIEKAISGLGWSPRWNLDTAISRTAQWYRSHLLDHRDARWLCEQDLDRWCADQRPERDSS